MTVGVQAQLEFDTTTALRGVDELEARLVQVTQTFAVSLADAIAQVSGTPVAVDINPVVDASAVAAELAAVSGSVVIDATADVSQAQAEIDTLAAAPVTVEVDANTSAAASAIDDVGKSASTSSSDVGDLKDASAAFSAVAGVAAGDASGLSSAIGSISPEAKAGVGALTILTGSALSFFNQAVGMTAATERFNRTFGDTADVVNQVKVGDLDQSLASLNLQLGSSTSQVRNALSSFAQLGQAGDLTAPQIATTSSELEALAARAVALNPALGSVGDVAEQLGTRLARGGRFAAQFGLALKPEEIKAAAVEMFGLKDSFNQAELTAAAAEVATKKYGGTLKETIDEGTKSPIIQLRQISAEFSKFTTALGVPLIAPIFEIMRGAQPIFEAAARAVGLLIQALLPVGTAILDAFEPLLSGVFGTIGDVLAVLTPVFTTLGTVVSSLLKPALSALDPLLAAIVDLFQSITTAIEPTLAALIPLGEFLGKTLGFFAEGAALALGAVVTVLARIVDFIAPILQYLSPLGLLAKAFGDTGDAATEGAKKVEAFNNVVTGSAKGFDDTRDALNKYNADFATFVTSQSEFAKDPVVLQALRRTGIEMDTLRQQLNNGAKGFQEFVARGVESGQIKIKIDGVDATGAKVRSLTGDVGNLLNASNVLVLAGGDLANSFAAQAAAVEASDRAQFLAIATQQGLTDAQIQGFLASGQSEFGARTYANALAVLLNGQNESAAAEARANAPLANNAAAYVALAQSIASGAVTTADYQRVADQLGLTLDQVKTFADTTTAAIDKFVAEGVSKIPTASQVFDDLKVQSDPATLTYNLNLATLAALTFAQNLDAIRTGGFDKVADFLQSQGPVAAGAFAQNFLASSDAVKQNLDTSLTANAAAIGKIATDYRDNIPDNVSAATDLAKAGTDALGKNLDFDVITIGQLHSAQEAIIGFQPDFAATSEASGLAIGQALSDGISSGMAKGFPGIEQAARDAIKHAQDEANKAAGIHSPSTLFATLGGHIADGLALGITEGSDTINAAVRDVIKEAEAVAKQAAGDGLIVPAVIGQTPTASPSFGTAATAAGVTGGVPSSQSIRFDVTVNPPPGMTVDEARALGTEIAATAAAKVRADVFAEGITT